MLQREKENDERLTSARKALNQATERSQRMRAHYEDQVKRLQTKLTRAVAELADAKETAASDAVAAEARHRDELAESVSRVETLAAAREAKLVERLATSRAETERFKSQSVERFEEVAASDTANRARADAAEATVTTLEARVRAAEDAAAEAEARGRMEAAKARADGRDAAAAAAAAAAEEHARALADVDARVRRAMEKMRGENARLRAQLRASQDREAAMSRVLADQASKLLGE
jgi:hypothetical protein